MKLVIAEKGELARDIAGALLGMPPTDVRIPAEGAGWHIYAASGHLLELVEPGALDESLDKWDEEALPISFDPWPKRPRDKAAASKLQSIASAAKEADEIYCCGDADDEGQLIVDEILEYAGIDPASDICKRVYVNDNLPKNILKAFSHPLPNAECMPAGRAAHARQLADMCFGVNESRLATCRLKTLVTLGRVQTPTLGLVVERDRARTSHVAQSYFEVHATVHADGREFSFRYKSDETDAKGRFRYREAAERVARSLDGAEVAFDVEAQEKSIAPPLPFELTSLTSDLSKRHSMTASEVMAATQSLRDNHKAITYNRTDCPYLKTEHFEQAAAVTEVVMENLGSGFPIDLSRKSRAFDDSKVGAHHGIIPQERRLAPDSLTLKEMAAYQAISERYLVQFMPEARYVASNASISLPGGAGELIYKENHVIEKGWTEITPSSWVNVKFAQGGAPAPGAHAGRIVACEVKEGKTSPPKAFTDGTLISAMAQIARYVEDEQVKRVLLEKDAASPDEHGSIGTTATRPAIVEGLVKRGYIARNDSKGRSLSATAKAHALWDVLPEDVKGVDTTARWWLMQKRVEAGELDEAAIMRDVVSQFESHKQTAYENASLAEKVGTCPVCGRAVVARGKTYTCSSNKSERAQDGTWKRVAGCGFSLLPWCKKTFTQKQASALLAGKSASLRGCISKNGKKFDCKVRLNDAGRIEIVSGPPQRTHRRRM